MRLVRVADQSVTPSNKPEILVPAREFELSWTVTYPIGAVTVHDYESLPGHRADSHRNPNPA
jgi:hypothetical protein